MKAGGYTLEVRLPLRALGHGKPPSGPWSLALSYQDVSGLYETWWDGLVDFPAGAR